MEFYGYKIQRLKKANIESFFFDCASVLLEAEKVDVIRMYCQVYVTISR